MLWWAMLTPGARWRKRFACVAETLWRRGPASPAIDSAFLGVWKWVCLKFAHFEFWYFIIIFPMRKLPHRWCTFSIIPYLQTQPKNFACNDDAEWNAWVPFAGVLRSLVWFDSMMNLMAARRILPATRVSSGGGAVSVLPPFWPIQRK